VGAVPTAARDRVLPRRWRLLSLALKSLVGLGAAGCLAAIAFVAGGIVVFWYVLSKAPVVSVGAGVPDSLARMLMARGALAVGDSARLAFQPADRGDSILFVVSDRRVAVLTPHQVRAYPRDSIAYDFDVMVRGGLDVRYVLVLPAGRRDTVYPELTPRAAWELSQHVEGLLRQDSGSVSAQARTGVPARGRVRLRP
jgi:hypothetical protein